jgi:phosphoribosylformylglycinamidine synthase
LCDAAPGLRSTKADFMERGAGSLGLICLSSVDLGQGRNRLGGSILAQVFGHMGEECPDVERPELLKNFFSAVQQLRPLLLAYHDRSDGGLFITVCEMAFAGHCGVTLNLDAIGFDPGVDDVDAFKRDAEEQLAGRIKDLALAALFSEELGAVLQIRAADRTRAMDIPCKAAACRLPLLMGKAEQASQNPVMHWCACVT